MDSLVVTRYPLDPTGISPDNLVQDEPHTLVARRIRSIAPTYGGYYTESVRVTDLNGNQLLVKDVDYYCAELHELPTSAYGKEICGLIIIVNENISPEVSITYQALGGEYSSATKVISDLINNLNLDDRPVAWQNIIEKPSEFPPADHLHDVGDVYGFEYVVHAIDRLRNAIELGDHMAEDLIYQYIDAADLNINTKIDGLAVDVATLINNAVTLGIANLSEAQAGTRNDKLMTPLRTKEAINYLITLLLAAKASAEAGTDNELLMTPLRTKEAITFQAVTPLTTSLNAHMANGNNPHAVTKTQVGLSNIPNAISDLRTLNSSVTLATSKAVYDHTLSGDHDTRYVRKAVADETSLQVVSGQLQAFVNGGWKIVWPPQWQ